MEKNRSGSAQFGYYISLFTAVITIITFGIAVCTPPLSGPFCKSGCFEYPYHEIISRFPRDYFWMFPAIVLSFSYMVMMISVHKSIPPEKSVFSLAGVAFAVISTLILSVDYFVQVSFIQPSLLAGETEGIAVLSQYNPHGLFIILEELGFITMNISFIFIAPALTSSTRLERSLRLTFIIGFILMILSFAAVVLINGINREYRFEVIIISITWIELIIASILFSRYFMRIALA
ncbi:MAG: hypothetical protein IH591_18620 [Bacteroidales bacterium]|nr:hypothetical protein [Bacteroidales bacterium]